MMGLISELNGRLFILYCYFVVAVVICSYFIQLYIWDDLPRGKKTKRRSLLCTILVAFLVVKVLLIMFMQSINSLLFDRLILKRFTVIYTVYIKI